jgi:hypothetical protein
VDRLLVRAHALSPGFYTHAHRYVPSDSVWCEKDAAVADSANRNSGKRGLLWPAAGPPAAGPPRASWIDDDSIFSGMRRARSEIDFYIQASNACETGHRAEIGGTPSRFLYSYAQNGLQN